MNKAGKKLFPSIRRSQDGVTAVEFALCFPMLLVIVFGIFEAGRIYWFKNTIQTAVDDVARFVMMNPNASDEEIQNQIGTTINATLTGFNGAAFAVSTSDSTVGGVPFKTINATYTYTTVQGYLPISSTLNITSTIPAIP